VSDRVPTWYRRLGDVPGMNFAGSPNVDRRQLRWAEMVPVIREPLRDYPNQRPEDRLSWDYAGEWSTSDSPADRHWRAGPDDPHRETPELLEQRLYEALELPGTVNDYHFIVMAAATSTESLARDDPILLTKVEEFCVLDLRITSGHPDVFIWTDQNGDPKPLVVPACDILARLYRHEGAVREWLEVEEQAARLSQGDPDSVRSLISELETDAG
jgi:hypothetical protein